MADDQVTNGTNDLVIAGQVFQSDTAQIQQMNISAAKKAALLDKSYKKYANSLRGHGVQQATIDVYGDLIKKMPEQANLLVTALNDLTKSQLQSVLDLQKKQAELAMDKSNKLADAKTGIAAFATILSTIARYLGFDDFAETVDKKTQEIMGTVTIGLNTDGIGKGLDKGLNTLASNMQARIKANSASVTDMAQGVANSAPMDIQNAITPFVAGAADSAPAAGSKPAKAPQASKGVSWDSIKEGLVIGGASVDDQAKVKKLFANAAAATTSGDATAIDSAQEASNLIKSLKAESSLNKFVPVIKTVVDREMHITGNT